MTYNADSNCHTECLLLTGQTEVEVRYTFFIRTRNVQTEIAILIQICMMSRQFMMEFNDSVIIISFIRRACDILHYIHNYAQEPRSEH